MIRFGVLLIFLAMSALCVLVVIPVIPSFEDITLIDETLQTVLCQSGEKIERELYESTTSDGGTGYSMDVSCIDVEQRKRDVTGNWIIISVLAFLVPFLMGIGLVSLGANRTSRAYTEPADDFGFLQPQPEQPTHKPSFSSKLKELENAYQQGLITQEEYQSTRQRIFDELG